MSPLIAAAPAAHHLPNVDYLIVFMMFRLAAILHGIKGRLVRGNASSAHAAQMVGAARAAGRAGAGPGQGRAPLNSAAFYRKLTAWRGIESKSRAADGGRPMSYGQAKGR